MTVTKYPASQKQVDFILKLAKERVAGEVYVQTQLDANHVASVSDLSKSQASNVIGVLLKEPKKAQAEKPVPAALAEGYYFDVEDRVFQVVKSKSTGNVYAKVLTPPAAGKKKGKWVYAPGAMQNAGGWLPLDKESAASLGKKYGICMVCGALLSDDSKKYKDGLTSIERGIGPVCAGVL